MDKYIGKRLEGRYEIQSLIGTGGMANVYKAHDIIDDRTVAVKILREEFLSNTEFLRRFKNESKAIAVLSHPNIVRVYDVSFTGRNHSIVMEYIDGITLKDYIQQQHKLSWKEAVHFTLQILRALQHAHDKGIVHRDIKPQNIMLLQDGTIKVTDFGIARFARSEVRTITDRAIGSVHYISPEQAMGDNTDEKSDLYSVGVMLFEMLTGELPFEADSPVSVAIKQIQTQAVRPSSLNPDIPAGLEEITVRAMQKDSTRRYQSAASMIADIESFQRDPNIEFEYKYLGGEGAGAQDKKIRRAVRQSREEDDMRRRKKTPYIPILTGVTFAFVLATMGFIGLMVYLNNPFAQVDDIPVPDLVGIKYDTAVSTYNDIEIIWDDYVASSVYGSGIIVEQSPRAGREIKPGGTVTVKISSGESKLVLPNFTGQDATQVVSKITDMGLDPELISMFSSEYAEGTVIYTDPSRDSELADGAVVRVYVSRGAEQTYVSVPSLLNMTVEAAERYLEITNLRLGNITYQEDATPPDTIIAQDPAPGDTQLEGAQVNIVVSKGTETESRRLAISVEMPSIIRPVTLSATQDGETVSVEPNIVPSDIGSWNPAFDGVVGQVSIIRIYIDNQLYKEYTLDFETKGFSVTANSPSSFTLQD